MRRNYESSDHSIHNFDSCLNPLEEYDYTSKTWIANDGSDDILGRQSWANTSLEYSGANDFPVVYDVLALQLAHVGIFLYGCPSIERFLRKSFDFLGVVQKYIDMKHQSRMLMTQ